MLRTALLALLLLLPVIPAQAWTRAHVREADVELTVEGGGSTRETAVEQASTLRVALALGVEVSGGWLERLEIAGLSTLPESAEHVSARMVAEDGSEVQAQVRLKDGLLELRFAREGAPRRGHHRLLVGYAVPLSSLVVATGEESALKLEWTLPGWEAGLSRASIHWIVPRSARALPDPELAEQVVVTAVPEQRSKVSFERVHVPRESPWRVAVELPTASLGAAAGLASHGATFERTPWQQRAPIALAVAWVLLLAMLARVHARRWAAGQGLSSSSVLFEPHGAHKRARYAPAISVVLAFAAVWLGEQALAGALGAVVGLTLVLMERVDTCAPVAEQGPFEPMRTNALAAMRRRLLRERVGIGPFQDAGSVLGAVGVLGSLWALYVGAGGWSGQLTPWALVASCGVVPLMAAARWRLPRSLAARVAQLAKEAQALRLPGVALGLVWRRGASGIHSEPRLRVFSARPHHGLLRIDVMVDTRPGTHALTLCAVVLSDSSAARALLAEWPEAIRMQSGSGKRMAFAMPTAQLERDLERLLGMLAAHGQRVLENLAQDTTRHAA